MEQLDLIGVFMIAFVGSFGHCTGMCGGIVLAYSSKIAQDSTTSVNQDKKGLMTYHIIYNLGRITTYVILGIIVGALGSIFSIHSTLRGSLFIIAGVAMILAGLSIFGKIKFLTSIEYAIQNSKWYQERFHNAINTANSANLYILGLLNGLLPCGFVYTFLFSVAGFASALKGALIMLVFGLGTTPALLTIGLLTNTILQKATFRKIMMNIAIIAIIIFGISMIQNGIKAIQNTQLETHSREEALNYAK